jgi:long-chain acyl-CoA synthetase
MQSELVDAFERIRRDAPDRPLIYLPAANTVLSATHVHDLAMAIGQALDAAGLGAGVLVGGAIGNRPEAVSMLLACRRRGTPYVPLDVGTASPEIGAIARQFGVGAVVLAAAQSIDGFSRVEPFVDGLVLAVADADPGDSRHGNAAVLKMTSGSTGTPRATLTSEAVLMTDSRTLMQAMAIEPDDILVAAIPMSHAYGLGHLLVPALIQGSALLMRETFVPHRIPEDVRQVGARVFPGVPYMFGHFVANPPAGGWPPTLTRLITAGAPIERSLVDNFRALFAVKIHSFYGTSETGGIAFDDTDAPAEEGMVGTPLPGVTIALVGEDGAHAGTGRIHVSGPAVIDGYADGADATAFVDGGFLTGDLGSIDPQSRVTLAGRVSSFVNIAGRKVHPGEVERVLRGMAGVIDVRVIGVADGRRGEQLVAGLVVNGTRPSVLALRQFCGRRLAPHKIPRSFVLLDRIPLTARGKTDRRALEQAVRDALQRSTGML